MAPSHYQRLSNGNDTWRAGCGESRTSGSAGGHGKRTRGNPGTAPVSDPAPGWAVLWSVVLGLGGGACLVLALAFLGLRAQDATAAGALSAMAQSIGYLLAAAGPVIFGLLHTAGSGWRAPILLMCVAAAGQVVVAMVAGRGTVRPAHGCPSATTRPSRSPA